MFQGMEYVYEVYKERSFSKAASNLFISQPSLSANVKRIERKIGYPIFDRSTKPLGLTECGQHYIRAIEHIIQAENEFTDFINDWGELKTGQLVLGGSSFFSSWVLPPLIGKFSRKYPLVKPVLLEENTSTLARYLQSGHMDFLLDNCELESTIFDRYVYREEHLLLAVPKSLAINKALCAYQVPTSSIKNGTFLKENIPAVPLSAFSDAAFIFMKQENDTGKRAAYICQEQHFHPRILFELDQQMTSYNVTCSGMGISFIGDMLISLVPQNPDVVYYRLEGSASVRNIYFYWKHGRYISHAMNAFLKLISSLDDKTC